MPRLITLCFTDCWNNQHHGLLHYWLGILCCKLSSCFCEAVKHTDGSKSGGLVLLFSLGQAGPTPFWPGFNCCSEWIDTSERHVFPRPAFMHVSGGVIRSHFSQRAKCARCVHLISCRRRAGQCAGNGPADRKNEECFCKRKRQMKETRFESQKKR